MEKKFFEFIFERQLIWYRRFILKKESPWTSDEVLEKYKIINVYRELDKCTIYLLSKLNGVNDRRKLLANIVFYRFFNRINLYEELGIEVFDFIGSELKEKINCRFKEREAKGLPIFNNAYIISSGGSGNKKFLTILDNLEKLDYDSLIDQIDWSQSPEESLEVLKSIPMVGPFLACEFWTDLSYFNFFKQGWNDDDFVNIGPGAKWGLELIYGKIGKGELTKKLVHLHEIQESILSRLKSENYKWDDISYKNAFSNHPYLSVTNIEGSLCEFRKYWNIKNGTGRRKYFKPVNYLSSKVNKRL